MKKDYPFPLSVATILLAILLLTSCDPSGKMPFTTSKSKDAVSKQKEDVPGYMEGDDYALFQYDEGLSY